MDQLVIYVGLLFVIVVTGQLFHKSTVPLSLILVVVGMIMSIIPNMPRVNLNSDIVLNLFLPVMIYQISTAASWKDVRKNLNPILSLSVGHVIFITTLIAVTIHALIPSLGWPLAFLLGAVISPPDDVAIVSIAEKVRMPARIITILEGEGMLNDATALILFRFSLATIVTHEFSAVQASTTFIIVVIGELAYGLILGNLIGQLRLRIRNPILHVVASLLTPFLAYMPPEKLGGSGVLATVVAGFVIGHVYSVRFTPEFRLVSRAVWPTLAFVFQNILFLLVGLDFLSITESISSISAHSLITYCAAVIAVVIAGRFFWVFIAQGILPYMFAGPKRRSQRPRWQSLFIVSWSGMRGGISLAAALSVPALSMTVEGANAKDLLLFLIFSVIIATFLLQGLTLPWLIKTLGYQKYGQREVYDDHVTELTARAKIIKAVIRWLRVYRSQVKDNKKLLDQTKLYLREYKMLNTNLEARIGEHQSEDEHDDTAEIQNEVFLLAQIIEVERTELLQLWRAEKINLTVRNKILEQLDHRSRHLPS